MGTPDPAFKAKDVRAFKCRSGTTDRVGLPACRAAVSRPPDAAARAEAKTNLQQAIARLARYRQLWPEGSHVAESRDWQKRLRGELPSLLDKTKDIDAV